MTRATEALSSRWFDLAGGRARGRVIFLLALVLALDTADLGTIGSVAGPLERSLSLSNTQLGLLAAIPSIASALGTVPMGILVDRTSRVRLLWISMSTWSAIQALSATAGSFETLLLIRIGLGAATAVALPAVASLIGDLFPAAERGRIWGLILAGELVGAAFGYIVAGEASSLGSGSWRPAFIVLAIPGALGALAIRRVLPEPARGGGDQLAPGAEDIIGRTADSHETSEAEPAAEDPVAFTAGKAQEQVQSHEVKPFADQVLHSDPEGMSIAQAARYVLRVRTNVVLIVASALGYFYFTGVETFGIVYFQGRFHLAHGTATVLMLPLAIGGLVGVIGGGRLADAGLEHGRLNSRIVIGALSFALSALLFLPGLLTDSMALALPLMTLAGVAFGARNPPLDAARLDIMHHRLWGRAEAVRTLLRRTTTATAPILFGLIADALAPPAAHSHSNGTHGFGANADARGIEFASLVLLVTLVLGGLFTLMATRSYARDVATAVASELATADQPGSGYRRPATAQHARSTQRARQTHRARQTQRGR